MLPEHNHGAHLFTAKDGIWNYRCDGHAPPRSLATVYAIQRYGGDRWLTKVQQARWAERLDYECGLRRRDPSQFQDDCWPDATKLVWRYLTLFVALREGPLEIQPFAFAREFAIAYCGVTDEQARRAMERLEADGAITRTGRTGRAILWRLSEDVPLALAGPGAQPPADSPRCPSERPL